MATTLTKQKITPLGIAPAYVAADATGNNFALDTLERAFIHAKNTNAATRTITIPKQVSQAYVPGYGLVALADLVIVVPANTGDVMIGPIAPAYVDVNGLCNMTFSAVTNLTLGVFDLARPA